LQFLLGTGSLWLRLQSLIKELNEGSKRELVHVVHFKQITEDHEKVGTNDGEVAVDLTLFIKADLQLAGLVKRLLNRARLDFCLFQRCDQRFILENVACGA